MSADAMVSKLSQASCREREDILENLHCALLLNGGRMPFHNAAQAMRDFAEMISTEASIDVVTTCLQLITDIIPLLGTELDRCMAPVLPAVVVCIRSRGNSKNVCVAAVDMLRIYSQHADELHAVTRAIIEEGVKADDVDVRRAMIENIPTIFASEWSSRFGVDEILGELVYALMRALFDKQTQSVAMATIQRLSTATNTQTFDACILKAPDNLRSQYHSLLRGKKPVVELKNTNGKRSDAKGRMTDEKHNDADDKKILDLFISTAPKTASILKQDSLTNRPPPLEFGLFPHRVVDQLTAERDSRLRAQILEEMRVTVRDCKNLRSTLTSTHLKTFLRFLHELLDDLDFKVSVATLEILFIVVDKVGEAMTPHVKLLMSSVTKRMADGNRQLRQMIMKIVIRLMQITSQRVVLDIVCNSLKHRNPTVRQELLNVVIVALLLYSTADFDHASMCQAVSVSLVDSKRPVRQAAMECAAVLAKVLGTGRKAQLMQAVASIEQGPDAAGLTAALRARLTNRNLPRRDDDGLVLYATGDPTSADVAWVLSASAGYGSSAHSHGSADTKFLNPIDSSGWSSQSDVSREGDSRSRTKDQSTKLPWEMDDKITDDVSCD